MTATHETPQIPPDPQTAVPVAHYGGFRYNRPRNKAALGYIEEAGHLTVEPMADPEGIAVNDYLVAVNGVEQVVSARQAMKYAGDPQVTHSVSRFQQERGRALNKHHEAEGHQQVNAIFQSADALMGLEAVRDDPSRYKNVILAYPAGLARQPRISKASMGVAMSSLKSRRAARKLTPEGDFEAHLRAGPKPKTVADKVIAPSVALSYQAPLLSEIRAGKDAPGVSLVLGLQDDMMHPDKVIKELQSPNDVDYILITDTPHGINGRKDVMDQTLKLLKMTEQARRARVSGEESKPLADRLLFYGHISETKREELKQLAAAVGTRPQAT